MRKSAYIGVYQLLNMGMCLEFYENPWI